MENVENYDLIIIGGGPAGLSATFVSSYLKLNTLLIEAASIGGLPATSYPWKKVYDCLGFYKRGGSWIAKELVMEAKKAGINAREGETVWDIHREENGFHVKTDKGGYFAKAVILAIGMGKPRKLGVPGENLPGVIYSFEDTKAFKGKRIVVAGGGDTAVESAVDLRRAGAKVSIVHRKEGFRSTSNEAEEAKEKCEVSWNSEISEVKGVEKAEAVVVKNTVTSESKEIPADKILVCYGTEPHAEFFGKLGLATENGIVSVDERMRTNVVGIFAAGDVCRKFKRISIALGDGTNAAFSAFGYIKSIKK